MTDIERKFKQFEEVINSNKTFTITTHVNPDGDGVGSELALYRFLEKKCKQVRIINNNHIPKVFNFLKIPDGLFETYDKIHDEWLKTCDVIIILDISVAERLGGMGDIVSQCPAYKVCIDHHRGSGNFTDLNIINDSACATGELIYNMYKILDGEIDHDIAQALYTAILTDTGSFSHSNTSKRAFETSAELVGYGIDPHKIYSEIYERNPWTRIDLFARALGTISSDCGGKLAWIKVDAEMVEKSGASREEMDGFVEYLMTIGGVEMGIFFLEVPGRGTKVSIRSRGKINAHAFARRFGGGGHFHAVGIRLLDREIEDVMEEILAAARELF